MLRAHTVHQHELAVWVTSRWEQGVCDRPHCNRCRWGCCCLVTHAHFRSQRHAGSTVLSRLCSCTVSLQVPSC